MIAKRNMYCNETTNNDTALRHTLARHRGRFVGRLCGMPASEDKMRQFICFTLQYLKKIMVKKMRPLFFIVIFILPMAGSANFGHKAYCDDTKSPPEEQKTNAVGKNDFREPGSVGPHAGPSHPQSISRQKIADAVSLCQRAQDYWQTNNTDSAIEEMEGEEELTRQKEDMRFFISKRIYEIYASRKYSISAGRNEIPVTLNEQVEREIDLYTQGNLRTHFIASYRRSGKYRPMIVAMLKEEGLPQELSWLPLVESGFIVKALSKQRALGLWQFIPSTGHNFGLDRDRFIDERLDPKKSTRAAIDYLKELHGHFGDWCTALAAYNCGETRVLRIIKKQKVNYLDNFWDLYALLPKETARYVPKFLAVLHIVDNLDKYGLENSPVDRPLDFETLTVAKRLHLDQVAEITGIDQKALRTLNPELRQSIVPGSNYVLKIPEGSKQKLYADMDKIIRLNPSTVAFHRHRVQSGETLSIIASRYSTSIDNLMLVNNLRSANHIVSGKTIKIPQRIIGAESGTSPWSLSDNI
jgi:membrane-bound lytic murein transglycosylase D